MIVLYGHSEFIAAWVKARIKVMKGGSFGPNTALGVMNKGKLIAGVVYHDWQPAFRTIQVSCAAESPRWAMRGIMAEILEYPYRQLGVNRIVSITAGDDERTRRFLEGIGMTLEGVGVEGFGEKDAAFYRLLKREWEVGRFHKKEQGHGQTQSARAA